MTNKLLLSLLLLITFSFSHVAAQQVDRDRLRSYALEFSSQWEQQRAEAENIAERVGIPVRQVYQDGRIIELQRFEHGIPVYYETHNLGGAITSSVDAVWPGGDAGLQLTGSTQTLGMWDGGATRVSHQEFEDRVTQQDGATSLSNHATHVAGTMVAAGVEEDARGMSYEADLDAYDWNNDLSDAAAAAADGMLVSNHSYGLIRGWHYNSDEGTWYWYGNPEISETEDYQYGFYTHGAYDWDEVAYNAPHYQIVQSAGNSRLQGPDEQPVEHKVIDPSTGEWVTSETVRDLDGGPDGYQSIGGRAVAKNVLTVGAVEGIEGGYENPGDVVMSGFSSWGPTDDGRVKPEISAKGVGVYSALSNNDSSYGSMSGTSMSSPVVSGAIGLLQQLYQELHEEPPLSSTIRALLIHTADEAGYDPGPDYRFGFGLMNAERAAETLVSASQGDGNVVEEIILNEGQEFEYTVSSDGDAPLLATIAWTDPAGDVPEAQLNPDDIILVNDLDLRIEGPDETTYEPYVLDPENPDQPAGTGDNTVDNIEKIFIDDPQQGDYIVSITHKGDLEGGSQNVSLIITDEGEEGFEHPFAGGLGTEDNPYQIETVEQLDEVRNFMDSHFILTSDIDLNDTPDFDPIGYFIDSNSDWASFDGSFDGDGYKILNLTIDHTGDGATGLFAMVGGSGILKNVTLKNVNITGNDIRTGSLVGFNMGQVLNSAADGAVHGNDDIAGGLIGQNQGLVYRSTAGVTVEGDWHVGGMVGWNTGGGVIDASHATGDVNGNRYTGGLLGTNNESIVNGSSATGNVEGTVWVGGLIGDSYLSTVKTSFATGEVNGNEQTGALVGSKNGHLKNSYATGNVTADEFGGGLIGYLYDDDDLARTTNQDDSYPDGLNELDDEQVQRDNWLVEKWQEESELPDDNALEAVYSTGSVDVSNTAGGVIGQVSDDEALISDAYWDTEASGMADAVGDGSDSGITGLETDQMTGVDALSNMEGFDFDETWLLVDEDYPALYWEDVDISDQPSREVTFSVDMSVQNEMELFLPDDDDGVEVVGDFNNWTIGEMILELKDGSDWVYTGSVEVPGVEGDEINYLFKITAGDDRSLPNDGYEDPGDDQKHRVLSLGEINEPQELEVVYFSNMDEAEYMFAAGDGSEADPFQVETPEHLDHVRYYPDRHFEQVDDIDASVLENFVPLADEDNPFSGVYDGNDHEIQNLSIQIEDIYDLSLFGFLAPGSIVKDLNLIDVSINSTGGWTGAIAGYNIGKIQNVKVTGHVTGQIVAGGIVGENLGLIENSTSEVEVETEEVAGAIAGINEADGVISDSYADGVINSDLFVGGAAGFNQGHIEQVNAMAEVSGYNYVGGLSGSNSGLVERSSANGEVSGENLIGGLVGQNYMGEINQSFSDNTVFGDEFIGGLAGLSNAVIRDSYSVSNVTGIALTGGLLGANLQAEDVAESSKWDEFFPDEIRSLTTRDGTQLMEPREVEENLLENSYAYGLVEAEENVGALIGYNEDETTIVSSYWNATISGQPVGVGVGISDGLTGLSVDNMQQQASYTDWNFDTVWSIEEGESLPYLQEIGEPVHTPMAEAQLVHNSADPDLNSLEIHIGKDGEQMEEELDFRSATPFGELVAGKHEVVVRTTDSEPDTLYQNTLIFEEAARKHLTVIGVADENLAQNPDDVDTGFELGRISKMPAEASDDEQVQFLIGHGTTDLPSASIMTEDNQSLAENFAYGDLSDYLLTEAATTEWDVTDSNSDDLLDTFHLNFDGMAGEMVMVMLSGFYDPGANNNGESMNMLIVQNDGTVSEAVSVSSEIETEDIPDEVMLAQNYPNPFNPATTIEYAIPDETDVRLEVYNILGERVTVLVNETLQAGTYEATWDASDMASGVYIYRLLAGDQVLTKQMTYVK